MSAPSVALAAPAHANPAPLGLLGFGMTTVLLNIHNAGFFPLTSMILAMGIFYGGLAQLIAGVQEWKMGNTFGATAFTSYGCFWLTLVGLMDLPQLGFAADSGVSMSAYLTVWGVFTLFMFVGTLRQSRTLQVTTPLGCLAHSVASSFTRLLSMATSWRSTIRELPSIASIACVGVGPPEISGASPEPHPASTISPATARTLSGCIMNSPTSNQPRA